MGTIEVVLGGEGLHVGMEDRGRGLREGGVFTGNGVVSTVVGPGATVAVAVVARHGGLGEEGEGLFEDCVDVSIVSMERRWRS